MAGRAHKGTTWERRKALKALETADRLFTVAPEARMLMEMAEQRKNLQKIGDKMGWSQDELELLSATARISKGMSYLRELCDRTGMAPEERARVCTDIQRIAALALGDEKL